MDITRVQTLNNGRVSIPITLRITRNIYKKTNTNMKMIISKMEIIGNQIIITTKIKNTSNLMKISNITHMIHIKNHIHLRPLTRQVIIKVFNTKTMNTIHKIFIIKSLRSIMTTIKKGILKKQ